MLYRLLTIILLIGFASSGAAAQELNSQGNEPFIMGKEELWQNDLPSPYRVTLFDPQPGENQERLWSQTKLLFGLGGGLVGVVAILPSSESNRDRFNVRPFEKWWNNVRERPVWDNDDFLINYVGHTYFGGVYYQMARKSDFNQWNSFTYSALMSAFYWEYGLEAFAEPPSIQDLVVTPLGGWIYGEWAYNKEKQIRANGRRVWNSEGLGSAALFLLDPVEHIGHWLNQMLGQDLIQTGSIMISPRPTFFRSASGQVMNDYWGIDIVLRMK